MAMKKRCLMAVSLAVIIVSAMSVVFAAEDDPQPRRRRGGGGAAGVRRTRPAGGGGRGGARVAGRGSRGDYQKRMLETLKSELDATEEEWTVIKPKLTKVMKLARETGRRGMRARGRGERDGQDKPEESELQKAAIALQEAVIKSDTSSDEIEAKLKDLRDAQDKAKKELAKAQQELKESLSVRQEAKLVLRGMLD